MQLSIPTDFESFEEERFQAWVDKAQGLELKNPSLGRALLLVSDYAYEWLLKQPKWLLEIEELLDKDYETLDCLYNKINPDSLDSLSEYELKQWLRHKRHFYSIACISFQLENHISIQETTKLQSVLATRLIEVSYQWLKSQFNNQYGVATSVNYPEQDLVIMLMGKLGGGELNFSSDIDLIFCYPEDGETKALDDTTIRSIDNQKYFLRLAQKLVALLHQTTADGFVYRVDMRLRPYGESGALVMSFDAMADYYLEQGREWERFAMIKVGYLCPNETIKKDIEKIIKPFSFRRYIDFSVLDAIRQLKHKITTEIQYRNLDRDLKLGKGGIRELEFIVQSLQLISGGRSPQLQVKNWWQTLEVLTDANLLIATDAEKLKSAYEFLRRLENVLQFQANAQTQSLPTEEKQQAITAFAMGFESWHALETSLDQHRDQVETYFNQLFQDPHKESEKDAALEKVENWLNKESSEMEYSNDSEQQLLTMASHFKANFVTEKLGQRGQKRLNQLIPYLIVNSQKNKEPIQTFERCLSLMQSIGKRTAYFELLAENPPLLEHLVLLVSHSKWLVEQLKQYPSLLDELLFPANFGKILTKPDFQDLLNQSLLRIEPDNIEDQLLAIGRFKVASQFKVAAGFLNHRFEILEVTRQLTDIAELCVQALLRLAWREMTSKYGLPNEQASNERVSNFSVLGYGKLGSHELGFGSDLDLVFLYQGNPTAMTNGKKSIEVSQFYTRLTQRLVHYLNTRTQQGIMYEVDTRLRPSGRSGLLVSEFDAFVDYQENEAWTWEKQALVRARVVAGDDDLAEQYKASRIELFKSNADLKEDVIEMRDKMRANLDRTSEQQWDIKQGKGGLVDIEFLVQYWVLSLAQKDTALPDIYSNHFWLNWLEQEGHLELETSQKLKAIYEQYQSLVNQKRLDMDSGIQAYDKVQGTAEFVAQLWASTFAPQ